MPGLPRFTLVTGGAASGKSAFAERLVTATGRSCLYVATAQAHDAEMALKIGRHRARRGAGWTTVEAPLDTAAELGRARPDQVLLLDCVTMWLSNTILAERDVAAEAAALARAIETCAAPVVAVTNEVGQGLVPESALGRLFREEQGRLNQLLALRAGLVVAVMCGLPLALKGQIPQAVLSDQGRGT